MKSNSSTSNRIAVETNYPGFYIDSPLSPGQNQKFAGNAGI
jgi:hypothetical protein